MFRFEEKTDVDILLNVAGPDTVTPVEVRGSSQTRLLPHRGLKSVTSESGG